MKATEHARYHDAGDADSVDESLGLDVKHKAYAQIIF